MSTAFQPIRKSRQDRAADDDLRALYERVGPDAYRLARALSTERSTGEHAVVEAFAAMSCATLAVDEGLDRRALLAHVIAAFPNDSSESGHERLNFALAVAAKCSVTEIAQITGDSRHRVAIDLTNALRKCQRAIAP